MDFATRPPDLSFIVPTKDSARTITACLASLRRQESALVEVIVVDNGSSDGTADLAVASADVVLRGGPERSAQRNQGAVAARAGIVAFIDSDMVAPATLAAEAIDLFASGAAAAGVIPEASFGEGYLAQCRVLEKKLYLGSDRVEAARIFDRSTFLQLGGYDETLTGGEDWELPDRLRREGLHIGRVPTPIRHDEGSVALVATFRKKRYYGRGVNQYLAGSASARTKLLPVTPLRNLVALVKEPHRVPGLVLLKLVDVTGIATGIVDARLAERRRR